MLNLNYELLKLFQIVTKEPTLKDTAKIMGVTPSAISQSLKKLETEIGFQLFLREQKKLTLSPQGKELKNKLLPLLNQLENELAMIDFINMYTTTIDEFLIGFEELTLLLNIEKINIITNEIITAGIVVDLNKTEVLKYCKEIISK